MKQLKYLPLLFVLALIVSACGAQATPTVNAIDIQGTVAAAAFTLVAETQAAIPTTTPTVTATNTPASTVTLLPIPTSGPTLTPPPGGISFTPSPDQNSGAADPCINNVLPASLPGQTIKIRIDNPTKAKIMVTVYLQSGNPQGVCGYRGYTLAAQQSLVITDLVEGCYSI
jgi:hypothetical protein